MANFQYNLALSFSLENNRLTGTAKIEIPPKYPLTVSLARLAITGALIQSPNETEKEIKPLDDLLHFDPSDQHRTLYISYQRDVKNEPGNLVSPEGISLTDSWYPEPSVPYIYTVSARLPRDFSAISQSDHFPLTKKENITTAHSVAPTSSISFTAGPYVVDKLRVRDNLYVYSMFFREDQELAMGYLEAAAAYIKRYENDIAPFPYNHYVIVANRLPTGYGMGSYTLLGQMVLRLPFIKSTSLGHEIVHSWFGNAVEVDYQNGNWCEGLTAFLADHSYRAASGQGREDRKESLTKYQSYVHAGATHPFALKDFKSASHNQPMADYKRTVGYNGGAFFFHELREYLGELTFNEGVREFYITNKDTAATWKDLQLSFEKVSGKNLESFFVSKLNMVEAPEIWAEDIQIDSRNGIHLNFTLRQQAKEPLPLLIPVHIKTMSGIHKIVQTLTTSSRQVSIALADLPLALTLDPEYTLLRKLSSKEWTPVWSTFLGAEKKLIIVESEAAKVKYQPFLDALRPYPAKIVRADEITNQQLSESSLLFLGANQHPCRSLFGKISHKENTVTVDIRKNPLNPEAVAVVISDTTNDLGSSVARKLQHYGKYSYLEFESNKRPETVIKESVNGISYQLENLPMGGSTKELSSFTSIIEELLTKRVIYIGETHNSLADHQLQLRVIEALFHKDPNLAIGMEMFPTSSQQSLDEYTQAGSLMDEKTFLKKSDYFEVWRYDYRLFRNIMNFAKAHGLPVRGLNLDRQIVSEVYSLGHTDGLSDEIKESLVVDRNLDLPGYQERLSSVHDAHISGNHGKGTSSGFIQAQALWDETMAANIAEFLQAHSDYRMVVIAGTQHTRKDSGIPPRVAARIDVQQASLLNIYDDSNSRNLLQTSDYFFLAENISLPESPKIGIVLSSTADDSQYKGLVIDQISPHGKAKAAGLKEADILIRINDSPVYDMADLRIAMIDAQEGDMAEVEVLRGKSEKKSHVIKVELTTPGTGTSPP
ncbi:ChaN family lipoprotein [Desulforhopalus sp. IMCC35007]|uniref:ChaN family lipoprotein n=1 Tax=Desulforhopalus sp. IMCC35007 TaxID=2569543 RepID=UPI00145FCD9B|nr:ChaN family lipoprotein [Desulforhopalus sp. IMCC35007]